MSYIRICFSRYSPWRSSELNPLDFYLWKRLKSPLFSAPIENEGTFHQLKWHGHVQRMAEGRLPKIALKWMPKQKRARGRPKKNWMESIRKAMNERNLNEGQWEDMKRWSLGVGQRRTTFWNRHTYIQFYACRTFLNLPGTYEKCNSPRSNVSMRE